MYELKDLSEQSLSAVRSYPGLLSILVSSPLDTVFHQKLREMYHELHVLSGTSILIMAGAANWLSASDRRHLARDFRRTMRPEEPFMEMMVALPPGDRFGTARTLMTLQKRFAIPNGDLPSLVFLTSTDGTEGYAFPLDRGAVNAVNDDMGRDLKELMTICEREVDASPCRVTAVQAEASDVSYRQLTEWRASVLARIVPALNGVRLFRAARKFGPGIAGVAVRGLLGAV